MATTSKNAYEIRSDLLGLAKSLVEFNPGEVDAIYTTP